MSPIDKSRNFISINIAILTISDSRTLKNDSSGNLLEKRIADHQPQCWLINTGWWGGPYGEGKRIDLSITREILNKCITDSFTSRYFNVTDSSFFLK